MATIDWESVARELAGALDSCTTQIEQMKGMFPDDDGMIEQALQEADDADASYRKAQADAKVPVIDLDQLGWELIKAEISRCPRWIEGGKHGLMMNDIEYEICEWIKAGAPLPDSLPSMRFGETLVESIAEKIRDAGDENVLDNMLHDEFADQASAVNNSGLTAQIRYLIANDYGEQEILEKAGIATSPSCRR